MNLKVMIVEDESALVTMLRYNLEKEGFIVFDARDGKTALDIINEKKPDMLLLDWMLPEMSGVELCQQLRNNPETAEIPIIMLTARGEEGDKVRGLEMGADDYMTKPFSVPELLARIYALLRRTKPVESKRELVFEDILMDLTAHRVTRKGRYVHLGPTEFRLLQHLMKNPSCVYSREDLLNTVWGEDIHVELRTVDVHIRRLRKALNSDEDKDVIRTVRAAGYALESSEEES